MGQCLDALRTQVREYMDERRYTHTLGVEKEMRWLALTLAPELLEDAAVAGLLHDITKCRPFNEQIAYCEKNGLAVDEDEQLAPALLHAKTGAHYAREKFADLVNDGVYQAILRHTTAHPPLSLLGAMLFVADFTEEGRDYPDCVALREFLHRGTLDMAHFKETVLKALDLSLAELLEDGRPIALKTVEARNALLTGKSLF